VGAYLVGLWGFNSDILEAVAYQSRLEKYNVQTFTPAVAVHVGCVASYRWYKDEMPEEINEPNWEFLDKIGMKEQVNSWLAECHELLENRGETEI